MNLHTYGEIKNDPTTGREWHQCSNCGQVSPVDNDSMQNRFCMAAEYNEFKRAEKLFTPRTESWSEYRANLKARKAYRPTSDFLTYKGAR